MPEENSLIAQRHPEYEQSEEDWRTCADCYAGERAVKSEGTLYLPATESMWEDGFGKSNSKGNRAYKAYKRRAAFAGAVTKKVRHDLGVLWSKPPTIEVPVPMEPLLANLSRSNDSAEALLMQINEEQLITGRVGLHLDMAGGETPGRGRPYVSLYQASSIINWDAGIQDLAGRDALNLVVLDETAPRRSSDLGWEVGRKIRVLWFGNVAVNEPAQEPTLTGDLDETLGAQYQYMVVEDEQAFDATLGTVPTLNGNTLAFIPFVFVGAKDLVPKPDAPPLLQLAHKDLTIYRGEADYRQALHNQAQDTLVMTGVSPQTPKERREGTRIGAGAVIRESNPGAKVYMVGVDSTGIPEMRSALENDKREADLMAGSLTDTRTNQVQSGDSMDKRMASQSADLVTIAKAGAAGLERILRMAAVWLGLDPEEVVVTPNLEFTQSKLSVDEITKLQTSKLTQGLPLTEESLHDQMRLSGVTRKDYVDEATQLDQEAPRVDMGDGEPEDDGDGDNGDAADSE